MLDRFYLSDGKEKRKNEVRLGCWAGGDGPIAWNGQVPRERRTWAPRPVAAFGRLRRAANPVRMVFDVWRVNWPQERERDGLLRASVLWSWEKGVQSICQGFQQRAKTTENPLTQARPAQATTTTGRHSRISSEFFNQKLSLGETGTNLLSRCCGLAVRIFRFFFSQVRQQQLTSNRVIWPSNIPSLSLYCCRPGCPVSH